MDTREYHRLRSVEDEHWWFRAVHELALKGLADGIRSDSPALLDAGCGTGGLMVELSRIGRVEGIDFSPVAVELARKRGLTRVRQADLNAPSLPACAYDGIVSLDVLYHRGIDDDAAVLRTLFDALRPGGVLFLHLPAFEALRSAHDNRVHTRRRYRLSAVRHMLVEAGFVVEHGSYRVAALAAPLLLVRALSALARRIGMRTESDIGRPPRWLNRLLLGISRVENRFSLRLSLPFGVSLYVIARRPPTEDQPSSPSR